MIWEEHSEKRQMFKVHLRIEADFAFFWQKPLDEQREWKLNEIWKGDTDDPVAYFVASAAAELCWNDDRRCPDGIAYQVNWKGGKKFWNCNDERERDFVIEPSILQI